MEFTSFQYFLLLNDQQLQINEVGKWVQSEKGLVLGSSGC